MSNPGRIPDPREWHTKETYKGLIALGQGALRIAAVINGGAAVAFLAFMGRFFDGDIGISVDLVWAIRVPMLLFIAGLVCVGLASAIAYVTQNVLFNEEMGRADTLPRWLRGHQRWLSRAVWLVLASYLFFVIGAVMAAIKLT